MPPRAEARDAEAPDAEAPAAAAAPAAVEGEAAKMDDSDAVPEAPVASEEGEGEEEDEPWAHDVEVDPEVIPQESQDVE